MCPGRPRSIPHLRKCKRACTETYATHCTYIRQRVPQDVDAQSEFFLKSFIFALGDDWTQVRVCAYLVSIRSRSLQKS